MAIITAGRTDTDDFFRLSGVLEYKKLNHNPFIAFVETREGVEVRIVDNAPDLMVYPDDTKVMAQWSGRWRSDFFQFTVGRLREYSR